LAADTIDKLIFALDGDLSPLKAKYAQVEAETDRTAARVSQAWKNAAIGIGGDQGPALKAVAAGATDLERALGGVSLKAKEAREALIASSGAGAAMTALFKDIAKVAPASMASHTAAFKLTHLEMLHISSAARELATGQFSRLPITLALIATRMGGVSLAAVAAGAAILAVPIGILAATVKVESALARIRVALALTGMASGVGASQMSQSAAQIAAGGNASTLGALGLAGNLANAMVPGGQIAQAGIAGGQFELATGAKSEDVVKMIKEMFDDPAKSARSLNDSMNLLTYAQTKQIEDLTEIGDTQAAGRIILDAFNSRTQDAAGQVTHFAQMLNYAEVQLGNFAGFVGKITGLGAPGTISEQLADARAHETRLQHTLITAPGELTDAHARVANLEMLAAEEGDRAAASGQAAIANKALTAAMAIANKETGAFAEKIDKARLTLDGLALKERQMREGGLKIPQAVEDTRQAYARALGLDATTGKPISGINPLQTIQGRTPEALQHQATLDALAVAGAAPGSKTPGLIRATADKMRDLADPTLKTGQVLALYADRVKEADAATIKFNEHAGIRMDQRIKDLLAESAAAVAVAQGYDISVAAGERARAAGEAHVMVIKKEIAATMENAAAQALLAKAFATASVAMSEKLAKDAQAIALLKAETAAGGNPAAQLLAKARADATAETQPLFNAANAQTGEAAAIALQKAGEAFNTAFAQNLEKLDLETKRFLEDAAFKTGQDITSGQARLAGLAGGSTPDDMRHLEALISAFDLVSQHVSQADPKFWEYVNTQEALNVAASDLKDTFDKTSQAAASLANDITGPLQSLMTGGFNGNPLAALTQMGQNVLGTLVKTYVTDPLNEQLKGLFGGILGAGLKPDGSSPASALWVQMLGGAGGGAASASGGLGGGLSSILQMFGIGGSISAGLSTAGADLFLSTSGAVDFSSIASSAAALLPLAAGGPVSVGQRYLVGENGPELFSADRSGQIIPLTSPRASAALATAQASIAMGSSAAGRSTSYQGGNIVHNWIFNGPTDGPSVLRSRGQMEAATTRFAYRGERNS